MGRTIAIVGPTAAGKTGLSLQLAEHLGGEIVNADALQAYRELSIGTDKPTVEMRQRVTHHLIDILDPTEPYSAGEFARRARVAIADIHGRGRPALVVGGSGLYQRALFHGLSPLPRSDPETRRQLTERAHAEGIEALHAELHSSDPESAARLAPGDTQRILRALEVLAVSGRSISHWQRLKPPDYVDLRPTRIGLTVPRTILYDRVAERIGDMLKRGWLDEIESLLDRGFSPTVPAFQAIGYRQLVAHLTGDVPLDDAVQDTIRATRQYAKRQLTWFRKEIDLHWVSGLDPATIFCTALQAIT